MVVHSARRGAYRVFYEIDEDQHAVIVLRIDHRSRVYPDPGDGTHNVQSDPSSEPLVAAHVGALSARNAGEGAGVLRSTSGAL